MILTEFELFEHGHKVVERLDADGRVAESRPYTGRSFVGHVDDSNRAPVVILVGETGVYGSIFTRTGTWSIEPTAAAAPSGAVLQGLSVPVGNSIIPDLPFTLPASEPSGPTTRPAHELVLAAVAEEAFAHDIAYADKITAAVQHGYPMWLSEHNIRIRLFAIRVWWNDVRVDDSHCGGYPDAGLKEFSEWVVPRLWEMAPNAYVLFHASKEPTYRGIAGCANPPQLVPVNHCGDSARGDQSASVSVYAKDWHYLDGYDPDRTTNLGRSVHHEVTHLAGEPQHPADGDACGDHDLMIARKDYDCRGDWRTSGTIGKVSGFTDGKLRKV